MINYLRLMDMLSSANDTWNFIADDLDFAVQIYLKEWGAQEKGRVTKVLHMH